MQPIRPYDDRAYNWGSDSDEMPPSEYIDDEVVSQRVIQSTGLVLSGGPYTSNPPMNPVEASIYIDNLGTNRQTVRPSEPTEPSSAPRTTLPRSARGRPASMWKYQPPVHLFPYYYIINLSNLCYKS